jgi:hypothetical protein
MSVSNIYPTTFYKEKIEHQRVVASEEFEEIVAEGWQYLGTLPNGKIVVKNRQGSDPV